MSPRDDSPRSTPFDRVLYWIGWSIFLSFLRVLYRARYEGRANVPRTGGCLIVANHQSYLDPPIVGTAVRARSVNFIARVGLYKVPLLGLLIDHVHTIPIREDSSDVAAMKAAIKRIESGRCVCIFAEGSRSPDGTLQPFKRGVALLLKRAKCPVVPVAVEGAYDVFPRGRSFPALRGRVACRIGTPIDHAQLLADGADEAISHIAREIESMRLDLRAGMRERSNGKYPRDRLADARAAWLDASDDG